MGRLVFVVVAGGLIGYADYSRRCRLFHDCQFFQTPLHVFLEWEALRFGIVGLVVLVVWLLRRQQK